VLAKHELQRYKKFEFIYPPYQFQDKYMVTSPQGEMCPPTAEMREVLMGFSKDYTHPVMTAAERRRSAVDFDLARCSLLGNTFHAPTVAWLNSSVLCEWGILSRPATVAEVADPGVPASLGLQVDTKDMDETMSRPDVNLVRMYFSRLSHRGGDVSFLTDRGAGRSLVPRGIDAREWRWKDVVSTQWKLRGEHINVLECRALVLAMRWRFRNIENVGTKFLHLVDSQVTLGVAAKGRTSSWRLRRVLGKVNALLLAGFGTMGLGFVRTHLNPADRPSRREGRTGATSNSKLVAADDGQQAE